MAGGDAPDADSAGRAWFRSTRYDWPPILVGLSAAIAIPVFVVAVAFFSKIAPLVLALSAFAALGAALMRGSIKADFTLFMKAARGMRSNHILAFLVMCLAAWMLLGMSWAPDPAFVVKRVLQTGSVLLLGGMLVAFLLPYCPGKFMHYGLIAMVVSLVLHIALEWTQLPQALGLVYYWDRAMIVYTLLVWPIAYGLHRQGYTRAALAMAVFVGAATLTSESLSAVFSWACGVLFWGGAKLLHRYRPGYLIGLILSALFLAIPVLAANIYVILPLWVLDALRLGAAHHRSQIYYEFGNLILFDPWRGWGLGFHRVAQETPIDGLPPMQSEAWHPHNISLEIWVDLGLIGATISAALLASMAMRIQNNRYIPVEYGCALLGAVWAVTQVGFGAFESWWLATVALSAVALMISQRQGHGAPVSPR